MKTLDGGGNFILVGLGLAGFVVVKRGEMGVGEAVVGIGGNGYSGLAGSRRITGLKVDTDVEGLTK